VGARTRTIRRALLVLSIALFFRVFRLDSLPGFSQDEAYGAMNAARFAAGEPLHPLRLYAEGLSQDVVGGYQPGFYFALPSTFFRVFGWSLLVWRLASIVLSIGAVLLVYPLGSGVLGEKRAFLAALLLAGSRWHASDGRWGWHVLAADLLVVAGALLLLAGLKARSSLRTAGSGLLFSLATPLYGSAFPPLVFAGLLALAWRARRQAVAWLFGALIGLLPLGVMAVRQPTELLARATSGPARES